MNRRVRTVLMEGNGWGEWSVRVECGLCGALHVELLGSRIGSHRPVLRRAGWRRWKLGWVCLECVGPLGISPRQAQLVQIWMERGEWKPGEFSREMGISYRMVQYLREELVARGLVTVGRRPVLNLRRREGSVND